MSSENKSHLCVLCNNKLESKEALKDHFRKHANKEIDGKGRPVVKGEIPDDPPKVRGNGYEKGSASKFVEGVITCDVCGEQFKCNTTAIQHKFRKHPFSSLKFYCPECGKQFPLKIHRDNHLATNHESLGPQHEVTCNACGEMFYNSTALDYHFKSTHQRVIALYRPTMTPPPSNKIKMNNAGDPQSVYYCHLCGFEYIVKFNLQKHLEKQHSKEERENAPLDLIKCTTCDALFFSQRAYLNHNLYHKPDDLYVTSEQQRLQTVTRVDQDFDIRRVIFGAEKYLSNYPRRRNVRAKHEEKTITIEDSSDEMSPPSAMDTSSDSESELPLQKRLASEMNKEKTLEDGPKKYLKHEKKNSVKETTTILKKTGKDTTQILKKTSKDNTQTMKKTGKDTTQILKKTSKDNTQTMKKTGKDTTKIVKKTGNVSKKMLKKTGNVSKKMLKKTSKDKTPTMKKTGKDTTKIVKKTGNVSKKSSS